MIGVVKCFKPFLLKTNISCDVQTMRRKKKYCYEILLIVQFNYCQQEQTKLSKCLKSMIKFLALYWYNSMKACV